MIGEFRFLYFRIIHEVESEKTYLRTPTGKKETSTVKNMQNISKVVGINTNAHNRQ